MITKDWRGFMKATLFVFFIYLLAVFSFNAFAGQSEIRYSGVTSIPNAYTGTNGELLSGVRANHICCQNFTGTAIGICMSASGASACSDDWYYDSAVGSGQCFDFHALATSIFIRSWGAPIGSGIFQCRVWMKN